MMTLKNLYHVQKQDIHRAAVTLTEAFKQDDLWRRLFKAGASLDQQAYMFEMPVRLCLLSGGVYATSDRLEGVLGWLPGKTADVTFGRILRSGVLLSGARALPAMTGLVMRHMEIFDPLETARRTHMRGREYVYLQVVGVAPAYQGQGYGTQMVKALIAESERAGLPIYLETQTPENVAWYTHLGFRELGETMLPVVNLPYWEMVREPGQQG